MAVSSIRDTLTLPDETADCTSIASDGLPNAAVVQPVSIKARMAITKPVKRCVSGCTVDGIFIIDYLFFQADGIAQRLTIISDAFDQAEPFLLTGQSANASQ